LFSFENIATSYYCMEAKKGQQYYYCNTIVPSPGRYDFTGYLLCMVLYMAMIYITMMIMAMIYGNDIYMAMI
jgi:hypothetical protein